MKALALTILGILAVIVFVGILGSLFPDRPLSYQEMRDAERWSNVWFYGGAILIIGVPLAIVSLATAWGYVALQRFRTERKPDSAGRLPIVHTSENREQYFAVATAALLDGYHATQRQFAAIQPVPQSYAPHTSYSYAPHHTSGPVNSAAQLADPGVIPLALPDKATLTEYMHQIKPYCLGFGIDATGRLLQAPVSECYHLLASGPTRRGKSNSLNSLLIQLLYQQERYGLKTSISVLDYKHETAMLWKRSALVDLSTTDPNEMVDLLRDMVHGEDGLLKRQDLFAREGQRRREVYLNLAQYEKGTGEKLKRHYIVIDELNAVLMAAEDKQLANELGQILLMGAGAGFYVLTGAHHLDASTFKRAAKEQYSTRLLFGSFSQPDVNLLFGNLRIEDEVINLLDGRQGRGLVKLVSQTAPTPFQALEVEESDILPYIDQKPEPKQIEAQQQLMAETVEVIEALDYPISDAVRKAIWRKKKAKLSKADTIFQLWSIRKGGSGRYQEYAALYDQVIALGEPDGL